RGAGVRAGGSPATPPAAPTPALDPGSVPPLVVSLRRDGDVLRAEVRQPGLGKVAGPLIDAGLDWLRRASRPEGMVPYADFGPQGILLPPLR
ncbi:MAG TPA: hypothetical protein VIL46_17400, partial [Gemmataceae bacterium]